jgi:protein phosphatase
MQAMLQDVHRRILDVSSRDPRQRGMGTTLTMALVVGSTMDVVHIGDSRCYLIRRGVAEQLTKDHTLARQMVDSGGMTPEEEASSRWSSVLWNVLGGHGEGDLTVELRRISLEPGDTLVLCTDGLYRYVDARHLAAIVDASESPEAACRRLVSIANESGGEDNITVVVSGTREEKILSTIDESDTEVP